MNGILLLAHLLKRAVWQGYILVHITLCRCCAGRRRCPRLRRPPTRACLRPRWLAGASPLQRHVQRLIHNLMLTNRL